MEKKSPGRVQPFATPWPVAHQAPLSMGFSRQGCWGGLPGPPPGDLRDPGIEQESLLSPALTGGFFTTGATWEAQINHTSIKKNQNIHKFINLFFLMRCAPPPTEAWKAGILSPAGGSGPVALALSSRLLSWLLATPGGRFSPGGHLGSQPGPY